MSTVISKQALWVGSGDSPKLDGLQAFFTKIGVFCPIKTCRRERLQRANGNICRKSAFAFQTQIAAMLEQRCGPHQVGTFLSLPRPAQPSAPDPGSQHVTSASQPSGCRGRRPGGEETGDQPPRPHGRGLGSRRPELGARGEQL